MSEDLSCDVCIIGSGLAGLNALFVAAERLGKNGRVVLIDRNSEPGGMWNTTYDFVRLHQPHQMFTVGNLGWQWNKPDTYFPDRAEIQAHLASCLERLRGRVDLSDLHGHEVTGCEEIDAPDGGVRVVCAPVSGSGPPKHIHAKKVIRAFGSNVPDMEPLNFSSQAAISTTPQGLPEILAANPGAPVYIIGGGKTGMDTILRLGSIAPDRDVTLLNGRGTVFARRDVFHPTGMARWTGGNLFMRMLADIAIRFDGDNETEVLDYFTDTYGISLHGTGKQHLLAFISREEIEAVADRLTETVDDYLEDVIDAGDGLLLKLRHGAERRAPQGSIFVNCTGSILRGSKPYTPYLSQGGSILTIAQRSAVVFQPSVAAFFLSHLFLTGKLGETPLYEMDMKQALELGSDVWLAATMAETLLNHLTILHAVPPHVLLKCHLDIDRWYPLPRRGLLLMHFKRNEKRYQAHCKKALDRLSERLGLRFGLLEQAHEN